MNKNAKIYVISALSISWILTFIFYFWGQLSNFVILIMLIPALCALFMRLFSKDPKKYIFLNPNKKSYLHLIKAFIFSFLFPITIITACAITGALLYAEPLSYDFFKIIFSKDNFVKLIFPSFLSLSIIFSFGEEYGWRGYLLPELVKNNSKIKATTITGIVWALYHFPVLILLNIDVWGFSYALKVALIQAVAAFIFSFGFAQCYFISNRVYPVVVMHTFWNMFNPRILGSVYDGASGIILKNAPVAIINGEGILGIVFGSIATIIIIKLIKKNE